jgi:hypothetical protein
MSRATGDATARAVKREERMYVSFIATTGLCRPRVQVLESAMKYRTN